MIGIDLFAGAGGLSLGAEQAGIKVEYAVENDSYAANAYKLNHKSTIVHNSDIRNIDKSSIPTNGKPVILFGGPPCQGFSTSNQKTRNKENPKNWLFMEFVRLAKELNPEWILLENVKGITETEDGYFEETIRSSFEALGFLCTVYKPCAVDFGVPQRRTRFFLIGSKKGLIPQIEPTANKIITVEDAFFDLPHLKNGADIDD